ncbi:MAG: hypothetical protein ACTHJR_16520 [Sphingomonas sp.]|uniref:hypothetical protein n=1 Tax=Sphingomonas sp. TaxID=28214 RepID=UPI003F7E25B4
MADVQKSAFSLSSATLMMAPAFTTDVFSLNPSQHSVGMVQEVQVTVDGSIQELLNGVAQVTVDSKRTNVKASITANVFEMTAQNYMRAHALSGAASQVKRGQLTTAAGAAAVSLVMNSAPVPGESASAISSLSDIPSGATLLIQSATTEGLVFPTKSSGAATGTGPYTVPIAGTYAIPTGMSFAIGDYVWVVQDVAVGNMDYDDLFGVKITGNLTNYNRPVTAVFPKVRVVKGFEIAYQETQYNSMPWELAPLIMSASEATGRLAEIGTRAPGRVYVGA